MSFGSKHSLKVVEIKWEDSEAVGEWTKLDDLDHELEITTTVGILIHEDKKVVLIASTYDGSTNSINAAIWIPRSAIKKITPIGRVSISANN